MANAPDPKKLAAELAADAARKAAEEQRERRESTHLWLFVDGERRVLRMAETSARHVQALRREGWDLNEVWAKLLGGEGGALDVFVAGWWLAGLQLGLVEEFDKLLDMSFAASPHVYFPSDEERASDGGGALDPPA